MVIKKQMNDNLITHIQTKIKSLKDEIKAIQYTLNIDDISSDNDTIKINDCALKIQTLNEVLISFGVQKTIYNNK